MSSTNSTTNYHLSQYVGSDKPTYLGDYNGDMLKIDTAIKNNADDITTNTGNIATVTETANTALGKANTNEETIGNVSLVANSALGKANTNEADIVELKKYTNVVSSETKIGKLGTKDLYRKIITYTQNTSTSSSGLVQVDIPTGISSVTRVYQIIGNYDNDNTGIYNTVLPNVTSTGGILTVNALIIGNSIDLRLRAYNHAINSGAEFEFIIEYTKD